jgi:hypothetical protein
MLLKYIIFLTRQHQALVRMILELEDGPAHMRTIVQKAGLQGIDITHNHTNYGDSTTLQVVGIACEVRPI